MVRRVKIRAAILLLALELAFPARGAGGASRQEAGLTFFGWSDQHVQTDGNGDHLMPTIDAMNALPGRPYPETIGGNVARPAFVFGLGDITEWPTHAAKDTYERLITERLKFPSYDVAGNHDVGGDAPSRTVLDWLVARHGALSYTFQKGGVHFIAVFSAYDESLNSPAQPISQEALAHLRHLLATVPAGEPVIVATHLCFDAITNRDEFVEALAGANVVAVLGGHYHKAVVSHYRGINFVQLPSPAPGSPGEFTVFRFTSNRLTAIPFDYVKSAWTADVKKILDIAIKGPGKDATEKEPARLSP